MGESNMSEENRTNQLLELIADEMFVFRKDKQEQEDQESGRPSTWRSAGERDALRQSLDTRRRSLNLAVGSQRNSSNPH
jgi:hypothetical protein